LVAQQLVGESYEIIFVNDGSPDDSLEVALKFVEQSRHVRVIDLSRNFGHHKAMMAGLEYASGEMIYLIDVDLEEEPEWLLDFFDQMISENVDVVYGVQARRKGGVFERISGFLFYSVFNWLSNINHPRNIVTARLMTRRYVDALLLHRERELVISCIWMITGFSQSSREVKKHSSNSSTYNISNKISHSVNAITSFSSVPLYVIFYSGIMIFIGSFGYALVLIFYRVFFSQPVDGWTSIMVSVWFLGGMITSFIGIIGIYLAKIFSEVKRRPYVIVRKVYESTK
jgi:putative glycosyltransferase